MGLLVAFVFGGIAGGSIIHWKDGNTYVEYNELNFSTKLPSNWGTQVESDSDDIFYEFVLDQHASITVHVMKPAVGTCLWDPDDAQAIDQLRSGLEKYGPISSLSNATIGQDTWKTLSAQQFTHDEVTTEKAMIHNGNTPFHRYDTYTVFSAQCGEWEIVSYSDAQHRDQVEKVYQTLLTNFVVSPNQIDSYVKG